MVSISCLSYNFGLCPANMTLSFCSAGWMTSSIIVTWFESPLGRACHVHIENWRYVLGLYSNDIQHISGIFCHTTQWVSLCVGNLPNVSWGSKPYFVHSDIIWASVSSWRWCHSTDYGSSCQVVAKITSTAAFFSSKPRNLVFCLAPGAGLCSDFEMSLDSSTFHKWLGTPMCKCSVLLSGLSCLGCQIFQLLARILMSMP